ncbi:MAG TPA: ParB/RepB/Spo0J family partition protein [Stellaceae bacterium]|nr:ParB/RepB/Spo0J family partition protein [Stellaceae bacterium]
MSEEGRRRNLGRGLSALFGEESEDYAALDRLRQAKTVPIDFVRPGRFQPRQRFDEEALQALAQSIREKGVLQPLLVRRHPEAANAYEIIAGERRWRAAQMAQLHEIPVVIREFEDREALEIALVENIQRQDLSPLEEAEGYRRLMEEFGHTQERLAEAVGKSRSHVANMMRLLGLPDTVKELLAAGTLSAGHARALLNAADPAALAAEVVRRGLNVRATEKLAQAARGQGSAPAPKPPKDADTAALERDLANLLGLRVTVNFAGRGGSLTIHYRTLEQLDDVLRRLHQIPPSR